MTACIDVAIRGSIAEVVLNRPRAYNAFDLDMMRQLTDALMRLADDDVVRGLLISANGSAFCAGGDLKWATGGEKTPARAFHELAACFHQAILEIRRMPKPVAAAIDGVAAGGGFSLALACDFRIMAQSAVLRQAYTSAGLCLDGGGSFHLPRLVGLARALEIAAFDRPITARRAEQWGLATRVVPDGTARRQAFDLLDQLAGTAVHAFGRAKQLFTDAFHHSIESHLELERQALCACAEHPEGREGLTAFAEKRKPRFSSAPLKGA